jgi:NADPH:quinone reductase-like Zn-dependent oxidoreductase
MTLPQKMKALRLHDYRGLKSLKVEDVPLPIIGHDEILIKVEASPINPSDDLFCDGLYKIPVSLPMTPGFEGSGTVVAAGKSFMARRLVGKWVASATQRGDGFWAEYVKVKALEAMPFDPNVLSPEQAAMSFVNPLSAMALIDPLINGQHKAMVQTAAASQLGRMIARLAKRYSVPVIHCVHRKELIPNLMELGAKHVLVNTEPNFVEKLRDLAAALGATYAIDAVGGQLTGQLADALPNHSTIAVYGALAKEAVTVDPGAFIFKDQKVEGFWLGNALAKKSFIGQFLFVWRAKQNLTGDLASTIKQTISMSKLPGQAAAGLGPASSGKTILKP